MKTLTSFANTGCKVCSTVAGFFLIIAFCPLAVAQLIIPINNEDFDGGGGEITSAFSLLVGTSSVGPQQIGTSGWYGRSNATNAALNLAGFRPGIEVDNDASSTNVGEIRYNLGGSLGGLLGLEMPEATLWQPLTGEELLANSTYVFSVDVDAGTLLDVTAFSDRGFGIGVTTGSTTTTPGTYFADSLTSPFLLDISLVTGTTQRLTLTFTTGNSVPTGDIGVAVFGGRGTQSLQVSLLTDFDVDNASLTVVPEPASLLLLGIGFFLLLNGRAFLRRNTGSVG